MYNLCLERSAFWLLFKHISLFDPQLLQRVSWGWNSQPYAHLGRLLTVFWLGQLSGPHGLNYVFGGGVVLKLLKQLLCLMMWLFSGVIQNNLIFTLLKVLFVSVGAIGWKSCPKLNSVRPMGYFFWACSIAGCFDESFLAAACSKKKK